jgi:undecaprenyl diphosphate synthase
VPDGNGRWAEERGLSRLEGHRAGAENINRVLEYLDDYGIKYVTIYAFSTENWSRPISEVKGLFHLAEEKLEKDLAEFNKRGVRLCHLGRLQGLPPGLQRAISKGVELTKNNTGMTLNLALNYGGRAEILDAVGRIIADGIPPGKLNEKLFGSYLYTADLPEVDLLIRTADELRLSNFLIWQTAYSEFYFTKVLWPDFNKKEVDKALLAYSRRQRRFGGL